MPFYCVLFNKDSEGKEDTSVLLFVEQALGLKYLLFIVKFCVILMKVVFLHVNLNQWFDYLKYKILDFVTFIQAGNLS